MKLHSIVLEDLKKIINSHIDWSKLKNKTVLITGANGMIASYLIYTLLFLNDTKNMNIKVIGLVRSEKKAKTYFSDLLERDDFLLLIQDVVLPVKYNDNIHYVIHAASQTSPNQFINDPVGTIKANTVGTINILDLAVRKKADGFLYLSTREIYGKSVDNKEFITENDYGAFDPTLVRSCYPESKRISETICASYKHQFGVNAKVSRIAHTYGPGITIGDGRVIGDFIKNVIHYENIALNSDGSKVLALTYLSDTVRGLFMHLLNTDEFALNISTNQDVISVKNLAVFLSELFNNRNINVSYKAITKVDKMGYLLNEVGLLDSSKINLMGWKPDVHMKYGFLRTIQYIEDYMGKY